MFVHGPSKNVGAFSASTPSRFKRLLASMGGKTADIPVPRQLVSGCVRGGGHASHKGGALPREE